MIIFDLDGTLADCEHRRHFVDCNNIIGKLKQGEQWRGDWEAFYEACDKDAPIRPTLNIFLSFWIKEGLDIEIWTGRSECIRNKTNKWIELNLFKGCEIPKIKMRPIGDFIPDEFLKEKWLDEALAEGKKIDYVFDDRPSVIRMWRRRGIFVFNCSQSDKEF